MRETRSARTGTTTPADPKEIWKAPGPATPGGIDAEPVEYERRVAAFLESALLTTYPQPERTRP